MVQPGQAEHAGQLDVTVVADLRGFATRLRREVNAAAAKITARVGVEVRAAGLRAELRRAVRDAAQHARVRVQPEVRATDLRRAIRDAASKTTVRARVGVRITVADFRRAVRDVSEKANVRARIGVSVRVADFRRAVREVAERAKARARIGVQIPVAEMRRAVKESAAAARTAAKVRVDADTKPARRAVDGLKKQLHFALVLDVSRLLGGVKAAVGALAGLAGAGVKAAGVSVLAAGAGAAASQLVAFTAALLPALNSVGLVPAVFGAAAAVMGVLQLATAGVGDALSETFEAYAKLAAGTKLTVAEQEKLDEALARLSPSARAFVTEISRLYPAFDRLRLDVQERFFAGLGAAMSQLAETYLPALQGGLGKVASAINGGVRRALADLDVQAGASQLGTLLDRTAYAAGRLAQALGPVAVALLDVAGVGAGFLPDLADGLHQAAVEFGKFIAASAADGSLEQAFSDALMVLRNLWQVGRDVIGVVRGIFAAAGEVGGDPLGALGQFVAYLNEAVGSAAGQQALLGFFTALNTVGSALRPVLDALIAGLGDGGLGRIVAGLAAGLSPGLVALVEGLAAGLRLLAPAARPVGDALAAVGRVLAPLLPLVGAQLANVLTLAAGALRVVAAEAGPVIGVFAQFATQAARRLLPVIGQLVRGGLEPAMRAGAGLAQAFAPLVPALLQVVSVIAGALLPRLPELQRILTERVVPAVVAAAEAFGGQMAAVIMQVVPLLPGLVGAALDLAVAFAQLVTAVLPLVPYLVQIGVAVASVLSRLVWAGPGLELFTGALVAVAHAATLVATGLSVVVGAIAGFMSGIVAVVAATGQTLGGLFTSALPSWVAGAKAAFADLAARAAGAVDGMRARVVAAFSSMWQTAKAATSSGVSQIVGTIRGLPGRVGNMAGLLVSAGKDLVRGLIQGVQSMGASAVGALTGLVNNAVDAAKNALDIHSPSGVGEEIGKNFGRGYNLGVVDEAPAAARAATRLTDATVDAFNQPTSISRPGGEAAGVGGPGPLIGSLTLTGGEGGSVRDQLDEVMFQLRRIQRGAYAG